MRHIDRHAIDLGELDAQQPTLDGDTGLPLALTLVAACLRAQLDETDAPLEEADDSGEDAAGGGAYTCVPCARSFISPEVMEGHLRSKPHKRMAKIVAQPQYTQKEADAGAGRTS